MRKLISSGDVPMGTIMDLRDKLEHVYEYLLALSLGSVDERILLYDAKSILTALAALEFRPEKETS